jgi:hypothetical protein
LTTKKVITLVLAMLIAHPIFNIGQYFDYEDDSRYGLSLVQKLGGANTKGGVLAFKNFVDANV